MGLFSLETKLFSAGNHLGWFHWLYLLFFLSDTFAVSTICMLNSLCLSSSFLSLLFFPSALSSFYFTFWDISSAFFSNSFIESITSSVIFKFGEFFLFVFWMFLLIAPCSCSWVWCPFSLRTLRTASCCWHSRESFVSFGQPLFPLSCTFLLVALVPICYVKAVCRWLMAFDCQCMTKLRWHTAHWKLKSCCCCCYGLLFSQVRLCDPMGCSAPGFPFLHYLLEFAQTHVHWVSDAI